MTGEDRGQLWEAISAHRARLLRIARTRSATPEDAEDCVQEAMLRCFEFDNLDPERLGQLLTTITVRLCADRHRARQYGDKLSKRLAGHRMDLDPGPEESACDRAEASWLAARVLQLPQRQQDVVHARASGMSCAEIADRLRISYAAVESQIARARTSIRSARASALGLFVAPGTWKLKWGAAAGGAASLSAAAIVVLGVPQLIGPSGSPPGVDSPRQRPVEVQQVVDVLPTPVPGDTVALAGGEKPTPKKKSPSATPHTYASFPVVGGGVGEDPRPGATEYTTAEKIWFCYEYGVSLDPYGYMGCNYPPS